MLIQHTRLSPDAPILVSRWAVGHRPNDSGAPVCGEPEDMVSGTVRQAIFRSIVPCGDCWGEFRPWRTIAELRVRIARN